MPEKMRKGAGRIAPKPPAKTPVKDQALSTRPNPDSSTQKGGSSKGKK